MNLQTILSQLQNATNPMQMMMGMLNPNQTQVVNSFKNRTSQEQAQEIAQKCNELGISKDDLNKLVQILKRN